ncbi:DUF1579 domain-containing protein [Sphingopyxis sp.]|jgi:hypothetical protein|uniref:DUF1579 domain-containing protein n=1 Tax=Sphingopyxis sp. TaxID=1908224 RepID=UPI003F6E9163
MAGDFDFQIGSWQVKHRRLQARLAGCDVWDEFDGTCDMRPILGGHGNVEDNVLHIPGGTYRAVALRSFDPAQNSWAIWWLDGRRPHTLDVPVIGRFDDGIGKFYADDVLEGRPIRLRFVWSRTDTASPRWEQAMSADGGARWEVNWTMDFTRR